MLDCDKMIPTKTLIRHIKRRDWDGARLRTLSYPWDAHYCNHTGNRLTPMHFVCLYRAPLDLVELIVDTNPKALLVQDSEGWTPLHLTILYGGDDEVARLLIRRGGASAASLQSPYAGSPLHLACRHGSSIVVLEDLVQANSEMASMANENGTKPAEVVWSQFLKYCRSRGSLASASSFDFIECESPDVADLLQRLTVLLRAICCGQTGTKTQGHNVEPLQLCDLLSHQSSMGDLTEFLAIAVRLYPEQVVAKNDDGNLLLHMAASCTPTVKKSVRHNHVSLTAPIDAVDVLVHAFPAGASCRNDMGCLPLHLALKLGSRTWGSGVSSLVNSNPEALQVQDVETLLYPFQLAALCLNPADNSSLTTVFELLTACPHVVKC